MKRLLRLVGLKRSGVEKKRAVEKLVREERPESQLPKRRLKEEKATSFTGILHTTVLIR
jgi:hypothetical protein